MSGLIDLQEHYTHTNVGGLLNIDILGSGYLTIFYSILINIISFYLIYKLSKSKIINFHRSILIFAYHTFFSISMISILLIVPNDLDTYFQKGLLYPDEGMDKYYNFKLWGVLAMSRIYRSLYLYLSMGFISTGILFGAIGAFVIIFLDKMLIKNLSSTNNKEEIKFLSKIIIPFLAFFPSLSIWTGYLGKEILTIMVLIWFAYIFLNNKNILLIISFFVPLAILLVLIRPHFSFFFGVSFLIYLILEYIKIKYLKYFILFALLFISVFIGKTFIGAGASEKNLYEIIKYFVFSAEAQREYVSMSKSWTDTTGYNFFQLYLSFLFRPIIELGSPRNIYLSLENFFLIVVFLILLFNFDYKKLLKDNKAKFFMIFFISTSVIMALYTADLGVYWRQKWLLLPYFFIGITLIQKKE